MTSTSANSDADAQHAHDDSPHGKRLALLALGALGVVYGDIGTSPLYTLKACFTAGGLPVTPENVLGILSLIFWTLIVTVAIKYQLLVLRADNRGEGGILALLALLDPWGKKGSKKAKAKILFGLFGAALLYGDGVLTPAISVLSAIEGLELVAPALHQWVLPLTIAVLIGLFWVQRFGTGKVGVVFGPICAVWFAVLAALGLHGIVANPAVLAALNPEHAVAFFAHHGGVALAVLGAAFLAVTGGEALYADLGHFGRRPIAMAWFWFVLPALVLNYFGQGGMLLVDPANLENPFYLLAPGWLLVPLIALATAATVIASQAVISGAFSLMAQAISLGQSPRLKIVQTSADEQGQIYIPTLNWIMMLTTIAIVLGFESSGALASAYGIAVSGTMVITTGLMFSVVRHRWGWSTPLGVLVILPFLLVDLTYFGANAIKFHEGGWLPIALAAFAYLIMNTWSTGRRNLIERLRLNTVNDEGFKQLLARLKPARVPGTCIFMTAPGLGLPPALQHHVTHNRALHKRVILLSVLTEDVPFVPVRERIEVHELDNDLWQVQARFGFMQRPNVPLALRKTVDHGLKIDPTDVTYYIGRETVLPSAKVPGMMLWREKFFAFMQRNAARATDYYDIPAERTVELGMRIVI
jgi:KUP system potassium uptake protein